jgi:hypothetical protein
MSDAFGKNHDQQGASREKTFEETNQQGEEIPAVDADYGVGGDRHSGDSRGDSRLATTGEGHWSKRSKEECAGG